MTGGQVDTTDGQVCTIGGLVCTTSGRSGRTKGHGRHDRNSMFKPVLQINQLPFYLIFNNVLSKMGNTRATKLIVNNWLILPAEVIFGIFYCATVIFELPLTLFSKHSGSRHWVNGFLVGACQSIKF